MKNAIVIHGTEGYPEENWFPWLKKELEQKDYIVSVPQISVTTSCSSKNFRVV